MLCHGAKIGFFQGDIRLLMDDLKVLQPTVFPVVPRLLNRMFDRVSSKQQSPRTELWLGRRGLGLNWAVPCAMCMTLDNPLSLVELQFTHL